MSNVSITYSFIPSKEAWPQLIKLHKAALAGAQPNQYSQQQNTYFNSLIGVIQSLRAQNTDDAINDFVSFASKQANLEGLGTLYLNVLASLFEEFDTGTIASALNLLKSSKCPKVYDAGLGCYFYVDSDGYIYQYDQNAMNGIFDDFETINDFTNDADGTPFFEYLQSQSIASYKSPLSVSYSGGQLIVTVSGATAKKTKKANPALTGPPPTIQLSNGLTKMAGMWGVAGVVVGLAGAPVLGGAMAIIGIALGTEAALEANLDVGSQNLSSPDAASATAGTSATTQTQDVPVTEESGTGETGTGETGTGETGTGETGTGETGTGETGTGETGTGETGTGETGTGETGTGETGTGETGTGETGTGETGTGETGTGETGTGETGTGETGTGGTGTGGETGGGETGGGETGGEEKERLKKNQPKSKTKMSLREQLADQIGDAMYAGEFEKAASAARSHALLCHGSKWEKMTGSDIPIPAECYPTPYLSFGKIEHDLLQFKYLKEKGKMASNIDDIIDRYETMLNRLKKRDLTGREELSEEDRLLIGDYYNRIVYLEDSPRVAQALSKSWNPSIVEAEYMKHPKGVAIIDNFLSEDALKGLQEFCLRSTIWFENRYAHGRLGAFFRDGFNCPLLIQVAEEITRYFPHIIGSKYPLSQLWGFKFGPEQPPTQPHADFAAINVNFWITPDESNINSETGGLVIYDIEAPKEWDFDSYNRRGDKIAHFLRDNPSKAVTIPYRCNRAIIFNSDLFHATEDLRFGEDYQDRRINITLLFGKREDSMPSHFTDQTRQKEVATAR